MSLSEPSMRERETDLLGLPRVVVEFVLCSCSSQCVLKFAHSFKEMNAETSTHIKFFVI